MKIPLPTRRNALKSAQPEESSYDAIAEMYHTLWADWYLPAARPALEQLFFSHVCPGSRVLDLCCGCGHVTRELVSRGYKVTGVDASAALIAVARRELPQARFFIQDVRALDIGGRFDGVLSTFDSLNHILSLDELRRVFRGAHDVLKPGGRFVFDMNLEDAYALDLREWTVRMTENGVGLMRGGYDFETKLARTELIWFSRASGNLWQQERSVVRQRCYAKPEILQALERAGFADLEAIAATEAGMRSDLGFGRIFFVACAQE